MTTSKQQPGFLEGYINGQIRIRPRSGNTSDRPIRVGDFTLHRAGCAEALSAIYVRSGQVIRANDASQRVPK